MIEQLMERTDPGRAVVDETALETALEAVFAARPAPPSPRRGAPVALRWAGFALAAVAVVGGILAIPMLSSSFFQTPVSTGDYPMYASESEMIAASTAVLVVDIVAERPGSYEGIAVEVRSARIVADLDAGADGDHPVGSAIEIKEMPGEDSLVVGERYVVFIEEYDEVPASLINPVQGAYRVVSGSEAWPQKGNEIELSRELLDRLGLSRPAAK